MNGDDPLRAMWREQPTKEVPEMSLDTLRARSQELARKVSRRKWGESIHGGLCVALAVLGAGAIHWPLIQLACALLAVGEAIVILGMWRRSTPTPAPLDATGADFLAYYRAELARERDRLWTIAWWYLGPVVPGLLVLFVGVPVALGWVSVAAISAASIALTYAVILALYRRSARRIGREIEALGGSGA
jgi:hypothetical protein